MFTGIVEAVGCVVGERDLPGLRWLRIEATSGLLERLQKGGSVAVDGACLTAVEVYSDGFAVEAVTTTLLRTVAGGYEYGSRVNLERATVVGDHLDGHLVQGHVDGVGHLMEIRHLDGTRILEATVPPMVHAQSIQHGSIALNGVSLTINRLTLENRVEIAVSPHTWEATNLQFLSVGDPLNVEGDLIAKYVARLLRYNEDGKGGSSDAL